MIAMSIPLYTLGTNVPDFIDGYRVTLFNRGRYDPGPIQPTFFNSFKGKYFGTFNPLRFDIRLENRHGHQKRSNNQVEHEGSPMGPISLILFF